MLWLRTQGIPAISRYGYGQSRTRVRGSEPVPVTVTAQPYCQVTLLTGLSMVTMYKPKLLIRLTLTLKLTLK